ncbi:polysaccharide deacetylase [Paenibacillus filicis]|uniref:Polysaccharide deacetylase n=1 Tax=Paenibacillus gyeongsangnamensis TaxID=3388067 RepID=A0ABT4QB57_9BACL|nr:polysaccharide deacetylase family protein [Paenibacillus filicis]MCZ8514119.1 polysaccharide deacetylase [Paenibacillus filicis]
MIGIAVLLGIAKSGDLQQAGGEPSAVLREETLREPQEGSGLYAPGVLSTAEMTQAYGAKPYDRDIGVPRDGGGKTAYLTFDDGPSANTEKILNILENEHIHGTFFVIGRTRPEYRGMYRRIAAAGHALGNHTFSHDYRRIYSSVRAFREDTEALGRFLLKETGVKPDILRFPGGSNNVPSRKAGGPRIMSQITREMSGLGYRYFDWNVSSTDAAAAVPRKSDIVDAVRANSSGKKNAIVLMHDLDGKTTTVEALPEIIRYFKQQGYAFATLNHSSFTFQFLKPGG